MGYEQYRNCTGQDLLDLMHQEFAKAKQNNNLKTFTRDVRTILGVKWYSEHECRSRWGGKGLMNIILDTFIESSQYALTKHTSRDKIEAMLYSRRRFPADMKPDMRPDAPPQEKIPSPEPDLPYQWPDEERKTPSPSPADMQQQKVDYNPKAQQVNAGFTLNLDLAALATHAVKQYVNESGLLNDVQERIKAEAAKLSPTEIHINQVKVGEIQGRKHKLFDKVIKKAAIKKQVFIGGPAGTGKTTLASQIAKAMSLEFGHMSCTQGMSESHLLGRMIADGSYITSDFVRIYENGGVFLFDEVDAADANTLLVINSALANGHMSVPNRATKPIAHRHEKAIIICAANTFGRGSAEYAGRNILDAAFMDRFAMSKFLIEYDNDLEKQICAKHPQLFTAFTKIRSNVTEGKIRHVVSTRVFADGALFADAGESYKDIVEGFFVGWTKEEKEKAMKGVTI